jgi:hypothetical protein
MPYNDSSDVQGYGLSVDKPGRRMAPITASPTDFAVYPKALWIWVSPAASPEGPHVTILPAKNEDAAPQALELPVNAIIEFRTVITRAVTQIAPGVTVRAIFD